MDMLGRIMKVSPSVLFFAAVVLGGQTGVPGTIDLKGEWQLRLDPQEVGVGEKWFEADLPDRIALPGTVTVADPGRPVATFGGPTPVAGYTGAAWYAREIELPDTWNDKRVTLFIERTCWVTTAWVNGGFVGMRNSVAAPHEYDLSGLLRPGRNRLVVRVQNSAVVSEYREHAGDAPISKLGSRPRRHCERSYNGMLGRIELRATGPVWIEAVDAYPNVDEKTVRARVKIRNATGRHVRVELAVRVECRGGGVRPVEAGRSVDVTPSGAHAVEVDVRLGDAVKLWSEFSPDLYVMTASLLPAAAGGAVSDSMRVMFGMRELERDGTRLLLNGQPVFLRGRVDSAVFPLTGYAPMDVPGWRTILENARAYGLNQFRFHSWCPPEAAFQAADEMGFLFHVEPSSLSQAGHYEDTPPQECDYALAECLRIVRTYGNHPSFGFLSVGGNEQLSMGYPYDEVRERRQKMLMERLERVRSEDPRHLYTCTTHPWTEGRKDDYYVSGWGKASYPNGARVRLYGCTWGGPDMVKGSRFIEEPPETVTDFREELEGIEAPVITHEVGQWAVFPRIAEIDKYTGAYRAGNLELVRDLLAKNGLIEQAEDFVRASGQLSLRLYREEIESALRTPGLAGFNLLDLIDYPWQNTAIVGVLDAFWDSKGLITPEAWREFCGPVVPLARMRSRTWTTAERFEAAVDVAHYGPVDLAEAPAAWKLTLLDGRSVASGELPGKSIPRGGLTPLGRIEAPLSNVSAPSKLLLSVAVGRPAFTNSWELWVYPDRPASADPADVKIFREWGEEARVALAAGGKVLVLPGEKQLPHSLPGIFTPVYWSWLYFQPRQVGTMGLLCDPRHPAFAEFPTEYHSNWQWWEPITHSRTLVLDGLPGSLRPLIQVIDKFDTCRRLGAVFEARVGPGRLMVCTIDLQSDLDRRPVTRQLRHSLLAYMAGDRFEPGCRLDPGVLDTLFVNPEAPATRP